MSKPKPGGASNDEIIAMLKRYKCPMPFHAVRALFMGSISSPVLRVSPIDTVKQIWGGELPEFDSIDAMNELFNVLMAGLWNRLAEHQNSLHPFKLTRFEVAQTRDGVRHLVLVRKQEIEGFVDGLFGPHEHLDLPERAHEAINVLSEMRSMLEGAVELLEDTNKSAEPDEIKGLIQNIYKMTTIAETEINKAIASCKRARSRSIETMVADKPTLH